MALGHLHPSLALPPSLPPIGIPQSTAHILSLLFATSYVGSIYLATQLARFGTPPSTPPVDRPAANEDDGNIVPPRVDDGPKPGERDHPDTIKLRMKAVGSATILNLLAALEVVRRATPGAGKELNPRQAIILALRLGGFSTSSPTGPLSSTSDALRAAVPFLLAPAMLFGPLVAMYLDGHLPFQGSGSGSLATQLERWRRDWGLVEWRNYVVGPLTEELTFRSCILGVSILARCSPRWLVWGTPLWFGVAHIHHGWEMYKRNGLLQAIAITLFQLTYTTLFGWFASYLFIRTGSILPPLFAHVFCNTMGIYLPTTAVERHPRRKWLIIGSYVVGIVGFAYGLRFL